MSAQPGDVTAAPQQVSRRQAMVAASAALAAAVLMQEPQPANALGLKAVNARLADYGLPGVGKPPDGMKALLEIYGRDQNRETLLVTWNYPNGWITQRPSLDTNSEDGTVATGDYQKGDSAFLVVQPLDVLGGEKLSATNKALAEKLVLQSISQKGANQIQNFKLKKVTEGATGAKGQQYINVEFKYDLLTGAGFVVERVGYGSLTQVGKGVQSVMAVTTAARLKKLQPKLQEIASSFRVYDGILVDKLSYDNNE